MVGGAGGGGPQQLQRRRVSGVQLLGGLEQAIGRGIGLELERRALHGLGTGGHIAFRRPQPSRHLPGRSAIRVQGQGQLDALTRILRVAPALQGEGEAQLIPGAGLHFRVIAPGCEVLGEAGQVSRLLVELGQQQQTARGQRCDLGRLLQGRAGA